MAYLLETRSGDGMTIFPNLALISVQWHDAAQLGAMDCALDAISKSGLSNIHLILLVGSSIFSMANFKKWIKNVVESVDDDEITRSYWKSLHCVKNLQIQSGPCGDHLILSWLSKFPAIEKVTFDDWFKRSCPLERDRLRVKIFASGPCIQDVHI
jgi:hypothetical protein